MPISDALRTLLEDKRDRSGSSEALAVADCLLTLADNGGDMDTDETFKTRGTP